MTDEPMPPLIWWWHVMRTSRKIILVTVVLAALVGVTALIDLIPGGSDAGGSSGPSTSSACYARQYAHNLAGSEQAGAGASAEGIARATSLAACSVEGP
jgi:hypothetical protein